MAVFCRGTALLCSTQPAGCTTRCLFHWARNGNRMPTTHKIYVAVLAAVAGSIVHVRVIVIVFPPLCTSLHPGNFDICGEDSRIAPTTSETEVTELRMFTSCSVPVSLLVNTTRNRRDLVVTARSRNTFFPPHIFSLRWLIIFRHDRGSAQFGRVAFLYTCWFSNFDMG